MPSSKIPVISLDFMKIKEPIENIVTGMHNAKYGKIFFGIFKLTIFTLVAASIIILALSTSISMPTIIPAVAGIVFTAYTLYSLIEFTRHFWDISKKKIEEETKNSTKITVTENNTKNDKTILVKDINNKPLSNSSTPNIST